MISRRGLLALVGGAGAAACGGQARVTSAAAATTPAPLRAESLLDIVSGTGLQWLVQIRPLELLADPAFAAAVAFIAPPARLEKLAAEHYGGVDLRRAQDVVVAGYEGATLAAARVAVEPARVEAAFALRAVAIEGRAVEDGVTRLWGTVDGQREQIALFGRDAIAVEHGHLGPLRPAIYFAQGKLHRARPAIRSEPLAGVALRLGDAPLRAFVPGPFESPWDAALGGLLVRATAAAAAARLSQESGPALRLRIVLSGTWGPTAASAGERLGAAFHALAMDPLGHLMGIDRPLEPPRVVADETALTLDLALDPMALMLGLSAATGASLHEILRLSAPD